MSLRKLIPKEERLYEASTTVLYGVACKHKPSVQTHLWHSSSPSSGNLVLTTLMSAAYSGLKVGLAS
jgi:hypothetical protein